MADIGSGLLRPELLPDEPDAATWLAQGAALVTASGDKPLGGPQARRVLGRGGWSAVALRQGDPIVVGRVDADRCLLDVRCVPRTRTPASPPPS